MRIKNPKIINWIFVYIIFLASFVNFIIVLGNSFRSLDMGSMDLRNRVVGARLMKDGRETYFYHWSKNDPEKYIDFRDNPFFSSNRVTVPPSTLLIHYIFYDVPYTLTIYLWYFFQWLLFFIVLLLLSRLYDSYSSKLLLFSFGFLLASSIGWYFSVVAGQIYILYVLLITLAVLFARKGKNTLSVFLIALIIILRPFYAIFALPVFLWNRKAFVKLVLFSLGLFSLTIVFTGVNTWIEFFKAMHEHSKIDWVGHLKFPFYIYYPEVVEGINIRDLQPSLGQDYISFPLSQNINIFFERIGFPLPPQLFTYFTAFLLGYAGLSLLKRKIRSFEGVVVCGMFLVFVAEFFLPVMRYSYYDVQYLIVFALLVAKFKKPYGIFIMIYAFAVYSFLVLVNPDFYIYFLTSWFFIFVLGYYMGLYIRELFIKSK